MYRWLTATYPTKSEEMRRLKDQINKSVAHANITYAFQTFELAQDRPGFVTAYFDFEDDFRIKTDVLMIANIAMGMLQLFTTVNMTQHVFRFPDAFVEQFRRLSGEHESLRTQIQGHERFRNFVQ